MKNFRLGVHVPKSAPRSTNNENIFTARIRRMGKVMFSVCPHLGGYPYPIMLCNIIQNAMGQLGGYPARGVPCQGGTLPGGVPCRGVPCRGVPCQGGTLPEGGTLAGGTLAGGTLPGGTLPGGTQWGDTLLGGYLVRVPPQPGQDGGVPS